MAINDLLMRTRSYIYDRDGFEDFVDELLDASEAEREAVADYLAGHELAVARWVDERRKVGPWFWLDPLYVPAIEATLGQRRTLHVLGRGELTDKEELEVLGFGR